MAIRWSRQTDCSPQPAARSPQPATRNPHGYRCFVHGSCRLWRLCAASSRAAAATLRAIHPLQDVSFSPLGPPARNKCVWHCQALPVTRPVLGPCFQQCSVLRRLLWHAPVSLTQVQRLIDDNRKARVLASIFLPQEALQPPKVRTGVPPCTTPLQDCVYVGLVKRGGTSRSTLPHEADDTRQVKGWCFF